MEPAEIVRSLMSPEGRRDPYPWYARMHDQGDLFVFDKPVSGFDGVVHGFNAVDQVLRDPTFYMIDAEYEDSKGPRWRDHPALLALKKSIFFVNGAAHTQVRRIFNSVFTARRVAMLEPAITRLTEVSLDHLAALGGDGQVVDFMAEFAYPLPSNIMGELIGVPEEDRAWYRPRAKAMGDILDLDTINWKTMRAADTAVAELNEFFTALTAERRARPREDLMSALLQAQVDGADWLTDDKLFANLITVFNAGFVTTTQMFGHAVAQLTRRPEMIDAVMADRELVAPVVEEVLRIEPPAQFMIRIATQDSEIAGVPIREGAALLVFIGAANHDPDRFPDPDVFDPARPNNHPIAFGAGAHHCLGAALTRVEAALALPMLFERFPHMRLAEEPATPTHVNLRGYEHLRVRLTAGASRPVTAAAGG